ncbi:MAG: hypothetical protein HYT12_00715 [Candidatus Liptonbacteria bacterium]|nr:hypothetical protein [Candidatus Liptonbacteria bacterium]
MPRLPVFRVVVLEKTITGIPKCKVEKLTLKIFAKDKNQADRVIEEICKHNKWEVVGVPQETEVSKDVPFPGLMVERSKEVYKGRSRDGLLKELAVKIAKNTVD